ncbi:putative Zn-dependent protease [Paraburkholderia sp. 40]
MAIRSCRPTSRAACSAPTAARKAAISNGGGSGGTGGKTGSNDWRAPIVAQQLPDLGSGGAGSLSPQAERKLGERVMREIRRDPDHLDDWLVCDYLNAVAAKLAAAASALYIGGNRPDFELFAVRDAQINAFSLPGGFIGVNTGLIVTTQTESELASVYCSACWQASVFCCSPAPVTIHTRCPRSSTGSTPRR